LNHYEQAEHYLRFPAYDPNNNSVHDVTALAHAILALIDKLDDMPVLGFHVREVDE
jgi:hypothetical protein